MYKFCIISRFRLIAIYLRSTGTTITQLQAIELICDLVLHNPAFRDEFQDAGLGTILNILEFSLRSQGSLSNYDSDDPKLDMLLTSSRKALIYVEENELNSAVKPILTLKFSTRGQDSLSNVPAVLRAFMSSLKAMYSQLDTKEKRCET